MGISTLVHHEQTVRLSYRNNECPALMTGLGPEGQAQAIGLGRASPKRLAAQLGIYCSS